MSARMMQGGCPKGYKQTEVGVIPEDWDVTPIGHLKPFVTSGSRGWAAFYSDRGSPFIRITNLSRTCIYPDLEDLRFVDLRGNESEAARTQLQDGDVLISITADIGIVGHVTPKVPKPAYINQHIALVRFDPALTCSKFVSYFLASEKPQRLFRALTDSGAKAGMNLTTVQQIRVSLPPTKAEQEAIAEALSDADALIESLEQIIAKKCWVKQGAMQELLTGKRRLPGFIGEWEVKRLQEIADCLDNLRVPLNEALRNRMKGDYPYCGANGIVDYVDDYVVDDDIILMAEDGGYFDEYAYRPIAYRMIGKCWVNNHAHILKAKESQDQGFLYYSLVHKNILNYLASGTRAKLNKSEMNKIEVLSPRDKAEQTAIAAILSDMDAEIAELGAKLAKARQVKQGMMQELLTGRIRLV
ncbi:restriction endonuclease subunit S [Trichloromonas sp.]|uniref:restriction endonuclease subunit S n=1 Tax=Trichloromonas sp. TaxID=3069249 RepID=UPI002A4117D1|nr:restriction endonuclease subunit S [Trichloromonas sp.]